MSPETFFNTGKPIGIPANDFFGGGSIKVIPPSSPAKDITIGAVKGFGDTLKGALDLGESVARTATRPFIGDIANRTPEEQEQSDFIDERLKANNIHQKIGKVAEFALEFATPLGAPKALTAGRRALSLTKEGTQAVADVAGKTGAYVSGRLPKLLGIFTGEGDDVITAALRNPQLADEGIEGGDEALRRAVQEGSQNSIKIRNAFLKGHKEAKNEVLGQYSAILEPRNNVVGLFNKLLETNNVKVTKEGLDFTTSKIIANPGEVSKIQTAYQALKEWDKFTLESLDDYKQLVGKLTRFADEAGVPSKSPFLGTLYREINELAKSRLPKEVADNYENLNKNFSNNIELYDDLVDAFNSGDPFVKLANALGKNKDTLRQVLEFYAKQEGGSDVLPIVAGRELAMEKNAAFGFLNPRSWIDLLISPDLQAKATTRVGKILQRGQQP
jgi:hypothetical protein